MKLLRVVAKNYKLCEDNIEISLVPIGNKSKEDKEYELIELDSSLYVYNTLCFVGKNASGKTTVVELLALVYDILSKFKVDGSRSFLNNYYGSVNLDITFFHEGNLYRYITDIYRDNSFDSVFLFINQKLFSKKYKKTNINEIFNYDKYEEVSINSNIPPDSSILFDVLKTIINRGSYYSSDDNDNVFFALSYNLYKLIDEDNKILKSILKIFDEHLDDLFMDERGMFKITYDNKESKLVSNDELYNILSSGTVKGFRLFANVVYALKNGTDLIIDEIENHFHKSLVEYIISLFKDKSVNKYGSSLIFTTHYPELLDLFTREDNIYITKCNSKIRLENVYRDYNIRTELLKSKKFYNNAFDTNINYDSLMNLKKELM